MHHIPSKTCSFVRFFSRSSLFTLSGTCKLYIAHIHVTFIVGYDYILSPAFRFFLFLSVFCSVLLRLVEFLFRAGQTLFKWVSISYGKHRSSWTNTLFQNKIKKQKQYHEYAYRCAKFYTSILHLQMIRQTLFNQFNFINFQQLIWFALRYDLLAIWITNGRHTSSGASRGCCWLCYQ